ncbi:MAG: TRAP transporter substrate-binding protein DctP [Spirochaetales bacterium]|nr:TRAP transporter substrate-binding protein DctP [Spirochaetales bacterium]
MKKLFVFLFLFCSLVSSYAGTVIKLGSIAPAGSLWDIKLREIASEWKAITNGEVQLKLYLGGTVGDEDNMIRAMKVGGLNACAITAQGLKNIDSNTFAMCLPYIVKDDAEFEYVFDKVKGDFEQILDKQGFVTLGWAMTGWVNFFSKDPVVSPEDLKKEKIAIDTDGRLSKIWTELGFRAIPLSFNDLVASLYSGMIDALYLTPLAASSMGLVKTAPHMCEHKIAPVYCAFVVEKKAWNRVPAKYREPLKQRTAEIAGEFYDIIKVDEAKAIEVMKKNGLQIHQVSDSVAQEWLKLSVDGSDAFSRELISKDLYDKIIAIVNEYRKK